MAVPPADAEQDGARYNDLMPSTADLLLTIWLLVVLPLTMLATSVARRGRPPGDRVRRYQRTIALAAAPLLALAVLWLARGRPVAWLGLGAPGPVGAVLLAVALALVAALAFAAPRAKRPNGAASAAAALMMPRGAREVRWFLLFAVAVGAGWEILYRGYLFWALAPLLGVMGAVVAMGCSYGLAHGYRSPGSLAASIGSALLFAGGFALSGSLWWLIVIHTGLALVGLRVRAPA